MTDILISWQGPIPLKEINKYQSSNDYGIYQIYGHHPVYGNNVLLYIGKADDQTFGKRISQEENWEFNQDSDNVEVYIGRLFNKTQPDDETWSKLIGIAERLLIHTHWPAGNSSHINSITGNKELFEEIKGYNVINYDQHRSLSGVVSAKHELNEIDWFDEDKSYFSLND